MHFLEATDIGHLMIYYDGKVRKERKQEEKRPDSGRDRTFNLTSTRRVFYHCATTAALMFANS